MRCDGFKGILTIMLLTADIACKKPYNPPAISSPGSYLVVEGVINSGSDSTIIKLSRTVNLAAGVTTNPVTGAFLAIQGNISGNYPLTENSSGFYKSAGLNLDITQQYRLSITIDGQQYLSDFVPVQITPAIDSVGFQLKQNGIQVYLNTHDPANSTHYYRWDYSETWQFHSKYFAAFVSNGTDIVVRTAAQNIYYCFGNDSSSTIVLGSSAKLTNDVISKEPIVSLDSTSEKIETKYSIIVHEYALTTGAYTFYTNLKKNTEQLGSIFDAEPTSITGNIHNVNNPTEPVIGYISVNTVQSKRIFISHAQLPASFYPVYPYECELDTIQGVNINQFLVPLPATVLPVSPIIEDKTGQINGYLSTTLDCADCTLRGTKTTPSFWQY